MSWALSTEPWQPCFHIPPPSAFHCHQLGSQLLDVQSGTPWSAQSRSQAQGRSLLLDQRFTAPSPLGPQTSDPWGGQAHTPWARQGGRSLSNYPACLPLPLGSMSPSSLPCPLHGLGDLSSWLPGPLTSCGRWPCPQQAPQTWAETQSQHCIPPLLCGWAWPPQPWLPPAQESTGL